MYSYVYVNIQTHTHASRHRHMHRHVHIHVHIKIHIHIDIGRDGVNIHVNLTQLPHMQFTIDFFAIVLKVYTDTIATYESTMWKCCFSFTSHFRHIPMILAWEVLRR